VIALRAVSVFNLTRIFTVIHRSIRFRVKSVIAFSLIKRLMQQTPVVKFDYCTAISISQTLSSRLSVSLSVRLSVLCSGRTCQKVAEAQIFYRRCLLTFITINFVYCLKRVHDWMASNRLKLSWLGTRHQINKTLPRTLTLRNGTVLKFSTDVSNIGVYNRQSAHYGRPQRMPRTCAKGSCHWTKTLVQALITYRLDYCTSLLYDVSNNPLQKTQFVHVQLLERGDTNILLQTCKSCTGFMYVESTS